MMRRVLHWRRLGVYALVATVLATALSVMAPSARVAQADEAFKGGDFVPLTQSRLVDTRDGTGVRQGTIGADSTVTFQVTTRAGVPPLADVRAVALKVVLLQPTLETAFTLFPSGTPRPSTYHVIAPKGSAAISNSALVEVGSDGKISLRNRSGAAHAIVDVRGYFTKSTSTAGRGGFVPTDHTVIRDTWTGSTKMSDYCNPTPGIKVTGGVIPTGAKAAFVDLTIAAPSAGYVRSGTNATYLSAMYFGAGTTQSGLVLPISADGTIGLCHDMADTLINYRITVHGYFAETYNQGHGFQPTAGRAYGTGTLSAGEEATVTLRGKYGVPASGVSAYAVNLVSTAASGTGRLTVRPNCAGANPSYAGRFGVADPGSTQSIVKADCGSIVVKNDSTATVNLAVDVQGWFATKSPALPVQQFSRSSAVEVSPGLLEHAYVDNIGTLRYGRQSSAGNYSTIQWEAISSGMAFTGQPALNQLAAADTDVRVAALNTDNDVWSRDENTADTGQTAWQSWLDYRAPMKTAPQFGVTPAGARVLFSTDADGTLWHRPMSGTKQYWDQLGGSQLTEATLVTMQDGIRIFATNSGGELSTALYANDAISAWTTVATGVAGKPAVIKYPGDLLRAFVRQADGTVGTAMLASNGTVTSPLSTVGPEVIVGSPAAVLDPVSGRAEIVALVEGGDIRSTGETAQGSGQWRDWAPASSGSATEPTVVSVSSGASWLILFRTAANEPRVVTVDSTTMTAAKAATPAKPSFTTR